LVQMQKNAIRKEPELSGYSGPFPPVVRTKAGLRAVIRDWRKAGLSVGFVPTMGALHAGHLQLVRQGKAFADRVVSSIFVNPTQFAAHEDLGSYPRDEAGDLSKLASVGCDLAYCPDMFEMYSPHATTRVRMQGVGNGLETDFRPQFFEGVATVVTKLFNQVSPDIAFFGEKDFQQLQVIKSLVADLDMPVEVVGVPTVREADGLALSSRNAYLSAAERMTAGNLPQLLGLCANALSEGASIAPTLAACIEGLKACGFRQVDYVSLCDPASLAPIEDERLVPGQTARLFVAAWLGQTRLIDNIAVQGSRGPDNVEQSA